MAEGAGGFQVIVVDRYTYLTGILPSGEPGVYFGFGDLMGRKLAGIPGDSVNIILGQRPYQVVRRNHKLNEVFQFASRAIIGHYPDADSWVAGMSGPLRYDCAGRSGVIW